MRRWLVPFLLLSLAVQSVSQSAMWWNVENLFDCRHDSLKDDMDFLPTGRCRWTPGRYWRKLDQMARTIAAVAEPRGWPFVVGLCEVENDTVLRDLTLRSPLRQAHYAYIHHEGPDLRGVDVALLYRSTDFEVIAHESVAVPSRAHGLRPTRDLLHVTGTLRRHPEDTLHLVLVHFPSRAGAGGEARRNRQLAAETLRGLLERIGKARVLVMGDFNAAPGDPVLTGVVPPLCSLVPLSRRARRRPVGTYYFRGEWEFIDQALVSVSLLPDVQEGQASVLRFPFLLGKNGTPHRTYLGTYYQGGISDHLPLLVEWKP